MTTGFNFSSIFSIALAVFSELYSKSRTCKGQSLLQTPCEIYINSKLSLNKFPFVNL